MYPHSKLAWAVREGALVLEELEVNLADVVLQVKGGGEVGLAVLPGTDQDRLVGSMGPLVPPQSFCFRKHLLTHWAHEGGCLKRPKHQPTFSNEFSDDIC